MQARHYGGIILFDVGLRMVRGSMNTENTDTDVFADDEVHRGLCGSIAYFDSGVLKYRVYE
jgi:small neutral amino acid transporter SnatA (MarC family)